MGTTASAPLPNYNNSVYLLKDLPVDLNFGQKFSISVEAKSLIVSADVNSPLVGESAKILKSLVSDYIAELTSQNKALMLWRISWGRTPAFDITLYKEILKRLCNILHLPVFRIVCKVTHSQNDKVETRDKILNLTTILQASSFEQHQCFPLSPEWRNDEVKYDIILGWSNLPEAEALEMCPPTSLSADLFAMEVSKDLVIVAGNGTEIKCHKIIWERINVLARMLSPEWEMTEAGRTGRIDMSENTEQALYHFVRYLYGMKLEGKDITCDMALELFKLSDKYKLSELQDYFAKMFLTKGSDWFTPNDLIELYFHVENVDEFKSLQNYLLRVILSLSQKVRTCERFQELEETDPKAAVNLLWKLVDLK